MKIHCKLLIPFIILFNFIDLIGYSTTNCNNTQAWINENPTNITDRLETIRKKGVLTVASSNDVPFAYIDPKTNEFTGIDADIIKEAARRLGISKVEMKQVPFDQLLTQLNADDDIDMITDAMYVTEERKKLALFSNIWYKESETIITPKVSKINFKEDLKDATVGIGALRGTVYVDLAGKWKQEGVVKNVVIFNNQDLLLSQVNEGKIDAAITDGIVAAYLIKQSPNLYLNLSSVKEYTPEAPGRIAAAVRKSDVKFLNALNKVIDEMKEDLTISKILRNYGLDENYFVSVKDGHISN